MISIDFMLAEAVVFPFVWPIRLLKRNNHRFNSIPEVIKGVLFWENFINSIIGSHICPAIAFSRRKFSRKSAFRLAAAWAVMVVRIRWMGAQNGFSTPFKYAKMI